MVLGDEEAVAAERCHAIVKTLKDDLGDHFTWDAFYADAEAKVISWHVLVKIAASFKRYELRKDWFIKLMQYHPTTVSLASNAFVTKEHSPYDDPISSATRVLPVLSRHVRPAAEPGPQGRGGVPEGIRRRPPSPDRRLPGQSGDLRHLGLLVMILLYLCL
jgi:hypothetical protein